MAAEARSIENATGDTKQSTYEAEAKGRLAYSGLKKEQKGRSGASCECLRREYTKLVSFAVTAYRRSCGFWR